MMNLAEPSGSSPPEKPPGMTMIWLSRMAAAMAATESATSPPVRFFTTRMLARMPARSRARAVSYSQLVPGNTGMRAAGLATPTLGAARLPVIW